MKRTCDDREMPEPTAFLLALRASTADLVQDLLAQERSDTDVAALSLCDGWTRGHVLTHIARNADGMSETLAGALRGEIVERYPGGWERRNADISAGAGRPFAALVADVRDSAERLDRMFGAIADADGWELPTEKGSRADSWPLRRWREVEIHRVDLDAGYTPDRWPPLLVAEVLPAVADILGKRTDAALHVTVTADGSLSAEHVGREWTAGSGDDPVQVRGADWAILAWLIGRASIVGDALSAAPPLSEWS
jgi:maleylpyruvate isomerase